MKARAAAVLAALALLAQLVPLAHAQTTTDVSIPAVEKMVSAADYLARRLETLAKAVIVIAGLVGIINHATGKGPEWLWKAALAAALMAAFLWFVGYIMGG